MALMNKCFCCGLRSGSIMSAIYCMIFSGISVALAAYYVFKHGTLSSGETSVFVINALEIIFFITILIVSILLLCAIFREAPKFFIPFIIVMFIFVIIQTISLIIIIVNLAMNGFDGMDFFFILYNILCLVINILCVVCVTSYYQVSRDSVDAAAPAANYA
ncbi:uncharacterized protein LOC115929297 [Strongylocentrotus purpuratus]|uniref:Uncharacterized protein n=1 Tax=Strongylocentrotus purpuratus TaxID=7668 RepID=A0A7M7PNI0_STRPU|nr:uncharacterized protein LOC105441062 [Strongylocentrotus purpuratus]XP_030853874.1 uncharacterized protein LOC115929297 [Strongylocentrotus purpuratus]|eukprot:XP_011670168.1 PREDICTED: uncharacterized protein LOC105441062 [Strongylocentrotus purpuratus]